ncbi:MAG: 8-amino-7-oxononanoate synthase [Candidatus Margulisbacteria bacterium]|nr:8-amino-7-oxononanoate synthase [Candidatus Margulisiibacteriota bacterium]
MTGNRFREELSVLKESYLYRRRKVISDIADFPYIGINNRKLLNFGSNNYLGLGREVTEFILEQIEKTGMVQQASPLITGYTMYHEQLENKLAELKQLPSALLFSSGFMANLGLITALVEEQDLLVIDKLCHASIMECTKYKSISFRVFPHRNYDYLRDILSKSKNKYRNIYLATDTLFSMEGDKANLELMLQIAGEYDAYLICDDAHATGVYGVCGAGLTVRSKINKYPKLIVTGSLSKALQSYGGYIVGQKEITDYLVNKCRPYIYNTALPLIHVLGATHVLDVLNKKNIQQKLWQNICCLAENLAWLKRPEYSPIIPVKIGDNEKVLALGKFLEDRGFYVPAIRYPTVPKKDALLRISVSAAHEKKQLISLADSLRLYFE